ncbi:sorbosone dehydrogenase family protein [Nocardioides sp.]|uniref:PQQ-dependent sugar dehydrogenase n=1 Tax=Nocardioides sp. TaxID=35761 RepID=UPI002732B208|nr:PQQ-dependent sugar dehydrogenase [Nocardioides sp.]MDP3891604.1 PQQ-dependent sugar dehydrogenase [Nocardioides sp.]
MRWTVTAALVVTLAAPAMPAQAGSTPPQAAAPALERATDDRRGPALRTRRVVTGLRQPWDVQRIPQGLLITERTERRLLLHADGRTKRVRFPRSTVWAQGETGLMSLAVDPRFRRNRHIYACHGGFLRGQRDVRVVRWKLNRRATRVTKAKVLVRGIDATTGRHGGCRLLIARNGALLVGTGDAAVGSHPQNRRSLNGKVLRLDRRTGRPWPKNPWAGANNRKRRYVLTYGHRNVQGLAQRKDGSLWSVEHGPDRDDEVNRLVRGGNYGWHPVPGYNETVPMTDHSLPGPQVDAAWSSGQPTLATSGATWVKGRKWGRLNGTLAVAALKSSRIVFMKFDRRGRLKWTRAPAALQRFGRLRSITRGPGQSLLVTTANGSDDAVLRIRP